MVGPQWVRTETATNASSLALWSPVRDTHPHPGPQEMETDQRNIFLLLECEQLLCSFLEKFIQKIVALLEDEEEQEGEKVRRMFPAKPDPHCGSRLATARRNNFPASPPILHLARALLLTLLLPEAAGHSFSHL